MSTVIWDGRYLLADCRSINGQWMRHTDQKMIMQGSSVYTSVGCAEHLLELIDWYIGGADPANWPPFQSSVDNWSNFIVATKRGEGVRVAHYEQRPFAQKVASHHAWGAGRDFALAALYLGKDAMEAGMVAAALNQNTGHGFSVLDTTNWILEQGVYLYPSHPL